MSWHDHANLHRSKEHITGKVHRRVWLVDGSNNILVGEAWISASVPLLRDEEYVDDTGNLSYSVYSLGLVNRVLLSATILSYISTFQVN